MMKTLRRPWSLLLASLLTALYFVLLIIYNNSQQKVALVNVAGELLTIPMLIITAAIMLFSIVFLIRRNKPDVRMKYLAALLLSGGTLVFLLFQQ